jgi:hypothetical protein
VRFECDGACEAQLTYNHSSNGLILNEEKSVLVHTCRLDAAQEKTQKDASAKKWTRSKVTVAQLLRKSEEHEVDVTQFTTAKAFFDAIVRATGLDDVVMRKTSVYLLFEKALTQVFGTLEEQVGKLQALFKLLEDFYGDKIKTEIKTRKEGEKEVLQSFSIVMPYAKDVMRWGTRTLSVDGTFSGDKDHRIRGSCWTIVHKPLPGLQSDLSSRSALEASLPVVLAFEVANESTDTTKNALDALLDADCFDAPSRDELPAVLQRDEAALRKLNHWLVMSDGAKGLPAALRGLEEELGADYTVQLARDVVHMARNAYSALPRDVVADGGREKIKTLLKTWAQTQSRAALRDILQKARTGADPLKKALVKWLDEHRDVTAAHWTVAHTAVPRVLGFVTSNGAEGFNGTHAAARRRPLLHALVEIFLWSVRRYQELRVAVLGNAVLGDGQEVSGVASTPTAEDRKRLAAHERLFAPELEPFYGFHGEKYVDAKKHAAAYSAQQTPGVAHKFMVRRNARDAVAHAVDLHQRTCGCGAHSEGMPCVHASLALHAAGRANIDAELAMWGAFGTRRCEIQKAFCERVDVPESIDWRTLGTSDIAPPSQGPKSEQMAARSQKRKRKPRVMDRGRVPSRGERRRMTCGNCGGEGHNRRGCTKPAQAPKGAPKAAGQGD